MADKPKVAVVGVGPVGGIIATYLAHAGHYVVSCDIQKSHLDVIKDRGYTIRGICELDATCKRVAYGVTELPNFPEVDTVLIATKASILPALLAEIYKVVKPGMRFIGCQNGLDIGEYLAETFGQDTVLRMVINYGGSQIGDGDFHMSFFNPPNYIGAMTKECEPLAHQLAEMLTQTGLETQFTTDIKKYEWEKVVLSASLNPVCALTRKPMRDMMENEDTASLVEKLLREGVAVGEAVGITFEDDFLEHGLQYLKKAGYHRTSMHQDVLRQTPTEIDWINGKIVEWGRKLDVDTPYNTTITALIKGLELKSEAPQGQSESHGGRHETRSR